MYTTTADVVQWQNIFGVDMEHVDQLEIVRGSKEVPVDQVNRHIKWLKNNSGLIDFDGEVLTEKKLELQISCYLATKQISEQENFDFISVKCEPELCDRYVTQCMTSTFMNDPYDADGPKEPIVCACEVDLDGALTMQILKILTYQPVIFVDLIHLDKNGVFASTQFVCAPAKTATFARLCRKAGKYRMFIIRGEFVETNREKLRETIRR